MSTSRPNVIVITDDQHHAGVFGCKDRPQVRTPNLDRMTREGVSFARSYTPSAECVPSRMSFLTGMYVHTHGAYNGWPQVPAHYESLPNVMREHGGYQTALVGKKHFCHWQTPTFDTDTGDDLKGYTETYLNKVGLADVWKREHGAHIADYMAYISDIPYEHSEPVWCAGETIDTIDRLAGDDKPFFIWSNFNAPHPPYCNSHDSPHLYDPDEIDLGAIAHRDEADLRSLRQRIGATRLGVENAWRREVTGDAAYRNAIAQYYGCVSAVDEGVGRIMRHLESQGLLDNTIVVFTSDHGDFAGEYDMLGKNPHGAFECLNRVPLIWYWRGRFGSERIHSFVENVDIFPTLCDLLDLPTPPQVQGDSFADVLRYSPSGPGPGPQTKERTYIEGSYIKGVQTRQHRLVYCFDGSSWGELYDHQVDPHERRNVFDDPAYAHVRDALLREVIHWLMRTEQPIGMSSADRLHHPHRYHAALGGPPKINIARLRADAQRPWSED